MLPSMRRAIEEYVWIHLGYNSSLYRSNLEMNLSISKEYSGKNWIQEQINGADLFSIIELCTETHET